MGPQVNAGEQQVKKTLASVLLAVSVAAFPLGLAGISPSATAAPYTGPPILSLTNSCDISQLTTSTACIGTIINPGNDQPDTYLADYSFFGISNWTRVQKSDEASNPLYNLSVVSPGDPTGTWSVTGFGGYSDAVIVLKGSTSWSAYLLNVLILSGNWNTLGLINSSGHPDLSHLSLYVGGIKSGGSGPVVPLPAALPASSWRPWWPGVDFTASEAEKPYRRLIEVFISRKHAAHRATGALNCLHCHMENLYDLPLEWWGLIWVCSILMLVAPNRFIKQTVKIGG